MPSKRSNGYIMVGDSLAYEPSLEKASFRKSLQGFYKESILNVNQLGVSGASLKFNTNSESDFKKNSNSFKRKSQSRPQSARQSDFYGCSSTRKKAEGMEINDCKLNSPSESETGFGKSNCYKWSSKCIIT